jgi:hypothetical protein
MTSFGGFNGNPEISLFLESITIQFVEMVVSHSILLKDYQRKSTDLINVATRQVYPRIGLRLAAAKNKDNTPLFAENGASPSQSQLASEGYDTVRVGLYNNVIRLMTDATSPYSEGITNVAASLTAAILIKQLPLNGDIKNIDLGIEIEKQAFGDLDRIVTIYTADKTAMVAVDLPSANLSNQAFYIALDVDKATLPVSYFNVGSVDERVIIEQSQPAANIASLDYLTISPDKVAFCWYFVSGTEFESIDLVSSSNTSTSTTPSLTIYPPIEDAFFVKDGYAADDIISLLAEVINDAGLGSERESNVICSPNRGELGLSYVTLPRKKLYPDEADKTYDRKLASFRMLQRVNHLTFDVRRVSSIVNRELIIIRFFTSTKVEIARAKKEVDSTFDTVVFSYEGTWNNTTAYTKGQIVDLYNKSYICNVDSTGNNPSNRQLSAFYWDVLYSDASDLIPYRSISQDYIEGLIYGLNKSYTYMDSKGPKSIILSVQNGSLKVVTSNTTGTAKATTEKYVIDTFYFRLEEGVFSVSGVLKIRLSSTNLKAVPDIYPFLNPLDGTITVNLNTVSAEEAAVEILKVIYQVSQYTDVLCGLAFPNALQFTAFKKTNNEVKEVIDIIEVPAGLEIATGSSLVTVTPYKSKPRSLIVTATSIFDNGASASSSAVVTNGDYGTASAVHVKKNAAMQSVYDKINFLKGKY